MKDINKIVMNPVRMRILQYFSTHKVATAGELVDFITDVPRTTLYRHINILAENNLINVVDENRIRGAVQRTYALNIATISNENTVENATRNAYGFLMNLYSKFEQYFNSSKADPLRDKLFLNTAVLLMSDKEFDTFLGEINALMSQHLNNKTSEKRKSRNISIISSPDIDSEVIL